MNQYTGQMPGLIGPMEVRGPVTDGKSEVWLITVTGGPTGGSFKLKFEGYDITIAYNADGAAVQAAFLAAPNLDPGDIVVSGNANGPWTASLGGNYARKAVNLPTLSANNLTGGTAPSVTIQRLVTGVNATQRGAARGAEVVDSTGGHRFYNVGSQLAPTWLRYPHPRYTLEEFKTLPLYAKNDGYSTPTGATGDVDLIKTEGNIFEYHIKGTQTILAPTWDANGLNIVLDQVNDDGLEVSQGITTRSRAAFTIGSDLPFFFSVTFSIGDVSGTDDCAIGFRRAAAYQANVDDYTDMAVLNVINGDIFIETILNNAATVSTDTTDNWLDGETHTLTVKVSATGVVTYEIDGRAPLVVAGFTFDQGDVVVPFFFLLNSADIADAVRISRWECGLQ